MATRIQGNPSARNMFVGFDRVVYDVASLCGKKLSCKTICRVVGFLLVCEVCGACGREKGSVCPTDDYNVCGIVMPRGTGGFDYSLGGYHIGQKEKDGPKFAEKIHGIKGIGSVNVFLPSGYIENIMLCGEEADYDEPEAIKKIVAEVMRTYEEKYGFKFNKYKDFNESAPVWNGVDANGINFNVGAIVSPGNKEKRFLVLSLRAKDFINKRLDLLEQKGIIKRNSLLDLSLGGDHIGRVLQYDNGFRFNMYKMKKPIRHFTDAIFMSDSKLYGRDVVDTIEIRGVVNGDEGNGVTFSEETLCEIREEIENLRKIYTEKYGLRFKRIESDSSSNDIPRYIAAVNEDVFPGATLEIGRSGIYSDDGMKRYHVSVTLSAKKVVSDYVQARKKSDAKSVSMSTDKDANLL